MRCVHETSLYKRNCFITLTYNDENLPKRGMLVHKHYADFMKRLRKHTKGSYIRYYMAGEYGETTWRPHYHAIIFNHDWSDKTYLKQTGSGEKIYASNSLSRIWGHGHCSTGEATFESAAYIARYCMQKITGEEAKTHYLRQDEEGTYHLPPEYNQMSNGIGEDWLKFFKDDVYNEDYVIIRGQKCNVPAYYDKKFKRMDEEKMAQFKEEREWKGYRNREDNTPERLAVKEKVALAKINLLKREL